MAQLREVRVGCRDSGIAAIVAAIGFGLLSNERQIVRVGPIGVSTIEHFQQINPSCDIQNWPDSGGTLCEWYSVPVAVVTISDSVGKHDGRRRLGVSRRRRH